MDTRSPAPINFIIDFKSYHYILWSALCSMNMKWLNVLNILADDNFPVFLGYNFLDGITSLSPTLGSRLVGCSVKVFGSAGVKWAQACLMKI